MPRRGRAGLAVLTARFQAPRPEGYFAEAYPLPKDRLELEAAMARPINRSKRRERSREILSPAARRNKLADEF